MQKKYIKKMKNEKPLPKKKRSIIVIQHPSQHELTFFILNKEKSAKFKLKENINKTLNDLQNL